MAISSSFSALFHSLANSYLEDSLLKLFHFSVINWHKFLFRGLYLGPSLVKLHYYRGLRSLLPSVRLGLDSELLSVVIVSEIKLLDFLLSLFRGGLLVL
jgi:hypothetical protein